MDAVRFAFLRKSFWVWCGKEISGIKNGTEENS